MIYRVFCAGTLSHGQGLSVRSTRGVIYRRVAAAARRRGARADRQSSVARSTYGISLSPHNPASPLHTHTWSHERHERGTKAGNNRNQYSYHRYVGREEERTPRRAGPGWDWRRRTLQTYSTLAPSLSTASPPYPDLIPHPFFSTLHPAQESPTPSLSLLRTSSSNSNKTSHHSHKRHSSSLVFSQGRGLSR